MAIIQARHSFSTVYEQSSVPGGWDYCMTKAYCKWPAIAGIVIAVIVFCLTLFCCLRCCGCCGLGRGRRSRKNGQGSSMFNPMPYQGYQPANANTAPPPYNPPVEYAQFDSHSGGYRKGPGEDSLPAMPSWDAAKSRRVEDNGSREEDMEMGRIETQKASAMSSAPVVPGHVEADSHAVHGPHEVSSYTGPDFGAGHDQQNSYGGPQGLQHAYTGPDFGAGHAPSTAYSAYAPSESTKYEPSRANEPYLAQEVGTTYSNTLPPPSPSDPQQSFQQAPSVLQAGRKPEPAHSQGVWKDV